jgi:hypothetical protein
VVGVILANSMLRSPLCPQNRIKTMAKNTPEATPETTDALASDLRHNPQLVTITSAQPGGRRRAGVAFGTEPLEIDLSTLTPEQVEALYADPALSIRPKI